MIREFAQTPALEVSDIMNIDKFNDSEVARLLLRNCGTMDLNKIKQITTEKRKQCPICRMQVKGQNFHLYNHIVSHTRSFGPGVNCGLFRRFAIFVLDHINISIDWPEATPKVMCINNTIFRMETGTTKIKYGDIVHNNLLVSDYPHHLPAEDRDAMMMATLGVQELRT